MTKMDKMISNAKKKDFLKWFTKNYKLTTRESLWILDFLYGQSRMLEKTHFVESVDQAPRGIYMSAQGIVGGEFKFYKNGHVYEDPIKAFHEVRLNWSSDLYIEIAFEDAWQSPEYLAVLEDNPYAPWNTQLSEELIEEMDLALVYASLEAGRESLLDEIDLLLKSGDKENFKRLTKDLEAIETRMEEMTSEE